MTKFRHFWASLKRSLEYAIFGWGNFDWDDHYIYKLIHFKLIRVQKALIEGVAEHDKHTLQSLRVSIKLLERIVREDYMHFSDLHDIKWGRAEIVCEGSNGSCERAFSSLSILDFDGPFKIYRSRVTPETEEQEKVEFLEASRKDASMKARDLRLFHGIMAKYSSRWWD